MKRFIIVSMLLLLLLSVGKADSTFDGRTTNRKNIALTGKGLFDEPYLVSSYDDLCLIRDLVNQGEYFSGVFFQQTQDITFPDDTNWLPIGDVEANLSFAGCYNGNGHTINNIFCDNRFPGLFSLLSGEVRNLGIESGTFTGICCGSLASHGTETGKIINCYNKATVVGYYRAGGITDNFAGTIAYCWNFGNVVATSEDVITAGISSYGSARITHTFTMTNYLGIVNKAVFTGDIIESKEIDRYAIHECLEKTYQAMWNDYIIEKAEGENNSGISINRGNTIFLIEKNDTLGYDSSFQPSFFSDEKQINQEKFKTLMNERFSFSGHGTLESPFLIRDFKDLCLLRDEVDIGVTYKGYYFTQTSDIVMPEGEMWDPIGDVRRSKFFSGVYNGDGYVVKNVQCQEKYAGFFSYLDGTVLNLGIDSGKIVGDYVGGITSHGTTNAKIINCYNKAQVIGRVRAGGIADNYSGLVLNTCEYGIVSGLYDYTTRAGIMVHGPALIVNCLCNNIPLVREKFFDGRITDSLQLSNSKLKQCIEQGDYVDNDKTEQYYNTSLLHPIIIKDDEIAFGEGFLTDNVDNNRIGQDLPYIIIACLGGFFLIIYCVIRSANENGNTSKNEHETEIVNNIQKQKVAINTKRFAAICFTVIAVCSSCYITFKILKSKSIYGTLELYNWTKNENQMTDVLFVGSSQLSYNIDLAELWKEEGIAGYCYGAAWMGMEDTYYHLIEAEKTRHSKVVVIDVRACAYSDGYVSSIEGQQIVNVSNMPWSINKYNYINAVVPVQSRKDYFLEFPLFHTRYKELTMYDFISSSDYGDHDKGTWSICYKQEVQQTLKSAKDFVDYYAIEEKIAFYFNAIIDYCKDHEISLLVVKTPNMDRETKQGYYNTVELIANDKGVPFLDMNQYDNEIGIVHSDFYNDPAHLNVSGARKTARFLGKYLKARYQIDDHRGMAEYKSWDLFAAYREAMYLREISDPNDYLNELLRQDKYVLVFPNKGWKDDSVEKEFSQLLNGNNTIVYDKKDKLYGEENSKSFAFGTHEIIVTKDYKKTSIEDTCINRTIEISKQGFVFVVFDEVNNQITDVSILYQDETGTNLKHFW